MLTYADCNNIAQDAFVFVAFNFNLPCIKLVKAAPAPAPDAPQ
jgi:hypothetical protein